MASIEEKKTFVPVLFMRDPRASFATNRLNFNLSVTSYTFFIFCKDKRSRKRSQGRGRTQWR